jgi:soluble lytic murein transglycosylase-like protein
MPTKSRLAAAALGATAVATIPAAVFASSYIVRPGDTASDIAMRHGTTVAALLDVNRLAAPDLLRVGQMLQIPDASMALPAYTRGGSDSETHRVGRSEGVFEIARRFGVDPTALARTNGIGVNAPIAEGDELIVPGRLSRMNALVSYVAGDVGIDARLLRAVAWTESQWRQERVSPTGAVGIMQIEPFTGEWVSRHIAGSHLDIWRAQENVTAGAMLLRHLMTKHEADIVASLAGYYQGDASVATHGVYDDTRRYQHEVQALIAQDV